MRTIERDIVSGVLISKDGKIFLAVGTPGGVYPGTWKIPGGGVENGEGHEQTLERETLEETGVDISQCKRELVVDGATGVTEKTLKTGEQVSIHMSFYTYRVFLDRNASEVKVQLNDEFSEHAWYSPSELRNIQMPAPSIDLFKKLGYL